MDSAISSINQTVFGRWTILDPAIKKINGRQYVLCKCECGAVRDVRLDGLRYGDSKSCGCLQRESASKQAIVASMANMLPRGDASLNAVFRLYKAGATKRGLGFNLSKSEFRDIASQPCYYCGKEPSQSYSPGLYNGDFVFSGVDRIDNDRGYDIDNCVPCCWTCNRAKLNRNLDEFLRWIDRVYLHQHNGE